MRTQKTTILASVLAAFALTAIASLAGGASPAQAAILKNTDFKPSHSELKFRPNTGIATPAVRDFAPCFTDSVTLGRGTYDHGAFIVSQQHPTRPDLEDAPRDLRVRTRTTFTWRICRSFSPDPFGDGFGPARYQASSTLSRPNGFEHQAFMTFDTRIFGTGNYNWGGRIARACNDCTAPRR
jgi:hypothetical protein